jgi:hypothetical protein
MTFKCPCGKTTVYTDAVGCYNVGQAMKATGWTWMPLPEGGALWLCISCANEASQLAKKLFAIVGTRDIYLPALLEVSDTTADAPKSSNDDHPVHVSMFQGRDGQEG